MFYLKTGPTWSRTTVEWSSGSGTDLQPITGDWDGDGKTDIGLRRTSTGTFYFRTGPTWTQTTITWPEGKGSDLQSIAGDWDGDGKADIGLRRISTGTFYFRTRTDTTQKRAHLAPDHRRVAGGRQLSLCSANDRVGAEPDRHHHRGPVSRRQGWAGRHRDAPAGST